MLIHPHVTAAPGTRDYYRQIAEVARGKYQHGRDGRTDPSVPLSDRIWARIDRRGPDECWPFIGNRTADGYGKLTYGRSSVAAHRFVFEQTNGPIGRGLFVCHRCDNPACCNPGHLFVGSPKANTQDSLIKGRHGSLKQAGKTRGPYRRRG